MADDKENVSFKLDLDSAEFVKKILEAKESLFSLGKGENFAGLIEGLKHFAILGGAVTAAALAMKAAFDMTAEAESIRAIDNQFNALTKSVGMSSAEADDFKSALVRVSDGLVDNTDLIQAANKALIQMNGSYEKLPELLELAKNATKVFGGTLLDNFEKLNSAVAAGNTRMLRQFGIIIDQEAAQIKYAKSIGVTVQALTEQDRKNAILNETLAKGQQKLASAGKTTEETKEAWLRFKVAIKDVEEAFALFFDSKFGNWVRSFAKGTAEMAARFKENVVAMFGSGSEQAEAKLHQITRQADSLSKAIEELKTKSTAYYNGTVVFQSDLERLTAEHKKLTDQIELQKIAEEDALKAKRMSTIGQPAGGGDDEAAALNRAKHAQAAIEHEQKLIDLKQSRAEFELRTANTVEEAEVKIDELKSVAYQKEFNQLQAIDNQKKLGLIEDDVAAQRKVEIAAQTEARIQQIEDDRQAQKEAALQRDLRRTTGVYEQMAKSAQLRAMQAGEAWKKSGGVGGLAINSFQNSFMTAMAAMGEGAKSASEIMKGFFFGMLGAMASASGQVMVLRAFETFPAVKVPMLAAGGALIALGSFLSSMGRGGSEIPSGGGAGGGDVSALAGPKLGATEETESNLQNAQQSKRSVTIQVQGHYFETEQTKRQITEMIREYSDASDFRLIQIGQT